MKIYKDDAGWYVGTAYFRDGHTEGILEATEDGNYQRLMFTTETNEGYHDRYISTERIEVAGNAMFSTKSFYIRKTEFWKYDTSRIVEEHYMSGKILYSTDGDVYVPATIARIELNEECMREE